MNREETLYRMFGKFYPQGTILFNENDPAEEMFYIQSGRLRLTNPGDGERPAETQELGPGDLLGEDSFTGHGQRRNMAEVMTDSRLLVIDPGNVDSVVRNGPELAERIVEKLLGSLNISCETLNDWQVAHAWERVRNGVRSRGRRGGWVAGEMSAETGVEEFTVRTILDRMAGAGALGTEGGTYTLKNENLLAEASPGVPVPPGTKEGRK